MIYGTRVRLRAVERADLPFFVAWLNDPEVREGLIVYLPLSLEEEEEWFQGVLKRPAPERPLAIERQAAEGWQLLGNCGLHNLNWKDRSAELGIFIGEKQCWGQGYGSEALRLLIHHGFETLNLHRLYLHVYAYNTRAIRVYEKIGFVLEGRLRQARYHQGAYHDVLVMSVLRTEWKPS